MRSLRKGITSRYTSSLEDACIKFVGAVLKGVDDNPHYAMCECAKGWADIGGINMAVIYEKARRGTSWETVPLQILPHKEWAKKDKELRKV